LKPQRYVIRWSGQARDMLITILDRRVRQSIFEEVKTLENEPEKQGKPLIGELMGFRSLSAAGKRYRVIYQTEKEKFIVWILALGIRKEGSKRDIYTLAKKLIKLRLLE
jgi:mRNA interferase RelE/StbE